MSERTVLGKIAAPQNLPKATMIYVDRKTWEVVAMPMQVRKLSDEERRKRAAEKEAKRKKFHQRLAASADKKRKALEEQKRRAKERLAVLETRSA